MCIFFISGTLPLAETAESEPAEGSVPETAKRAFSLASRAAGAASAISGTAVCFPPISGISIAAAPVSGSTLLHDLLISPLDFLKLLLCLRFIGVVDIGIRMIPAAQCLICLFYLFLGSISAYTKYTVRVIHICLFFRDCRSQNGPCTMYRLSGPCLVSSTFIRHPHIFRRITESDFSLSCLCRSCRKAGFQGLPRCRSSWRISLHGTKNGAFRFPGVQTMSMLPCRLPLAALPPNGPVSAPYAGIQNIAENFHIFQNGQTLELLTAF